MEKINSDDITMDLNELTREGLLSWLKYLVKKRYVKLLRDLADRYDPEINDRKILKDDEITLFLLSELNYLLEDDEYYNNPFMEKCILKNDFIEDFKGYDFKKDYDYPENDAFITESLKNFIENFSDFGYGEGNINKAIREEVLEETADLIREV